jgi:hypothetical protein
MRVALGSFPAVSRRSYGESRSYQALWERWRAAPKAPLHIVGRLASGFVPGTDGTIHLDSILSAAVFGCDDVGAKVDPSESFVLPLPMALHWTDDAGRPLWLATDFRADDPRDGTVYLHSRYPDHRADLADRQGVLTSAGRYKDTRLPLRVVTAAAIEAWCIGAADDIRALLETTTHVGRKSAHGHGRVVRWEVGPAPGIDADWILDRRMTPVAALGTTAVAADRIAPRIGWTPPYWDARHHAACRRPQWTQ